MSMAASIAGIGFSNAGVAIPHAMSYPVSGMTRDYYPKGYPHDHRLVPTVSPLYSPRPLHSVSLHPPHLTGTSNRQRP
jgi:hypothetical protein